MSVALVDNFVGILGRVFVDRVLHGLFPSSATVDEQQVSIELFDSQVAKLLVPDTNKSVSAPLRNSARRKMERRA